MKKLLAVLSLVTLAACANPEVIIPYLNGPTYYKQHNCVYYNYPKSYKMWNYDLGRYDVYIRNEVQPVEVCNYNKLYDRGDESLMSVYR